MKRMSDIGTKLPEDVDSDLVDKYDDLPKGVNIYEISGPLFFGSAKSFTEMIKQIGMESKILIIRMRHVPFVDSTGSNNFKAVIKTIKHNHTRILLSGVNPTVLEDLRKSGIAEMIGEENIYDLFDKARDAALELNATLLKKKHQ
jgi:SulP family sulfate permease